MNKLLYIVGGTATGKTSLALLLAQKVGGDLISIDSRQVYTGMDIGTGKDIPKNFKKTQQIISGENTQTIYTDESVRIWGYDQISPDHEYSIALFKKNIDQIINHIHEQGKLPIIVGGSGLYAKTVENPPPSISIPQNLSLRNKLVKKSVEELQKMAQEISISRFESMNHSDVHNPRRLVRVIEIGNYQKTHPDTSKITTPKFDSLWIGLKTEPKNLEDKITARIEKRIVEGFEAECESLHSQGILRSAHQSGSAIGYAQWLEYESGRLSLKAYKEAWISAEIKYAKRQEVWFKKQENIFWHETENNNFPESVVQKVQVWYS